MEQKTTIKCYGFDCKELLFDGEYLISTFGYKGDRRISKWNGLHCNNPKCGWSQSRGRVLIKKEN